MADPGGKKRASLSQYYTATVPEAEPAERGWYRAEATITREDSGALVERIGGKGQTPAEAVTNAIERAREVARKLPTPKGWKGAPSDYEDAGDAMDVGEIDWLSFDRNYHGSARLRFKVAGKLMVASGERAEALRPQLRVGDEVRAIGWQRDGYVQVEKMKMLRRVPRPVESAEPPAPPRRERPAARPKLELPTAPPSREVPVDPLGVSPTGKLWKGRKGEDHE